MRDAGHRTPDAGHRTSDGEKSKNNISTPQGGGHNSKWLLYLARQQYFENWHGYSAEISSRSKILLNSLHLAQFSRYKHFCVLQKLQKFKIATIFGETKIFENKTTAAVCISRRALKEKK